jgi:hypothetical protein
VVIEEGGLEEYVWGGAVIATMFKLKLKMYRCCTFYNSARLGWLIYQSDKLYLLGQREEIRQQWGTASVDASSSVPLTQPHYQQSVASYVARDGCSYYMASLNFLWIQ